MLQFTWTQFSCFHWHETSGCALCSMHWEIFTVINYHPWEKLPFKQKNRIKLGFYKCECLRFIRTITRQKSQVSKSECRSWCTLGQSAFASLELQLHLLSASQWQARRGLLAATPKRGGSSRGRWWHYRGGGAQPVNLYRYLRSASAFLKGCMFASTASSGSSCWFWEIRTEQLWHFHINAA